MNHEEFRRPLALTGGVFLLSLALYVATLPPGLLWGGGDFARFQTWAYLGAIETDVDIFAHPLWVILAHPFTWLPLYDVAWRANFAAAVFGAAALVFVFWSAWHLTRSTAASLLATGALAVSHTFWTYAVMPKVYSLNALLLAACCYLLIRWREATKDEGRRTKDERTTYRPSSFVSSPDAYLVLFGLLYGLSFLNHLVMATAAAGFAAFIGLVLWRRGQVPGGLRSLVLAGASAGLGLAPYLYLMAQQGTAQATGDTIAGFLNGLLFALANPMALLAALGWGVALGVYQFPLTFLVGLVGLYGLWRRDREAALLIVLAVLGTVAFLLAAVDPRAGNVYVWNLHYYLQAYLVFSFALAAGFVEVGQRMRGGEPNPPTPFPRREGGAIDDDEAATEGGANVDNDPAREGRAIVDNDSPFPAREGGRGVRSPRRSIALRGAVSVPPPALAALALGLTLVVPIGLYAVAPLAARPFLRNVPDFRPLPGRDNLVYVLSPWKQGETGARDFGETIFRALPPNSVLFADYSLWAVAHYLQVVERARPDVTLVNLTTSEEQAEVILRHRDNPNLFLADVYRYYDLAAIEQRFRIVKAGPIYRLTRNE